MISLKNVAFHKHFFKPLVHNTIAVLTEGGDAKIAVIGQR